MYSVLIQNEKTMESFTQHLTLFADAIRKEQIGLCKWNESGTTIDTALPELTGLTNDREEWRAIIVRYLDDETMAAFETTTENPYDFLVNQTASGVRENEVPLVRLTQMLGGVPPVELEFRPEVIKEEHKQPRTIYVPVPDPKQEQAYDELLKKYRFNGKLPSSIVLLSIRNNYDENNQIIGSSWMYHKESESSEFWRRNQYPSLCRFLSYDFKYEGENQREADEFNFWLSTLLLCLNEVDPSTLQAYRLYNVRTIIDKSLLETEIQNLVDRLRDAQHTINKDIRRKQEENISIDEKLPDYKLEVPVVLKLPKSSKRSVSGKGLHLLSDGIMHDLSIWNREKREIEKDYEAAVRVADRTLEQTAEKMRDKTVFSEDDVEKLNRYQREDMTRETEDLYHSIITLQGILPGSDTEQEERTAQAAESVRQYLKGRVMKSPAISGFALAILLLVMFSVPAISVFFGGKATTDYLVILYYLIGGLLIVALCALVVLLTQKLELKRRIAVYNQFMKNAFNQLIDNASDYSKYMGALASYSRGCSYLDLSKRKDYLNSSDYYTKSYHLKTINTMLSKAKIWSRAYYLDVDFDSKRPDVRIAVDTSQPIIENKIYFMPTENRKLITINNSGTKIESPYSFISKIEIVREELYDELD